VILNAAFCSTIIALEGLTESGFVLYFSYGYELVVTRKIDSGLFVRNAYMDVYGIDIAGEVFQAACIE